jgi:hypothetical protein
LDRLSAFSNSSPSDLASDLSALAHKVRDGTYIPAAKATFGRNTEAMYIWQELHGSRFVQEFDLDKGTLEVVAIDHIVFHSTVSKIRATMIHLRSRPIPTLCLDLQGSIE